MPRAKKIERQEQLPGVENREIKELEDLALDYAEGRDERMAATRKEVELKQNLIAAMHAAKKTEYKREGIEITLIVEKEKVRVKVPKKDGEE